ncbi:integrase, partial [Litorimonas sp.]|uniref:integrase n=1 Tax=Litorimonas sp. TaxID=1892381 RepID=UPI003A8469CB
VEAGARNFMHVWDRLGTMVTQYGDMLVIDGDKLVIPRGAVKYVMEKLHTPHQGIVKTQKAARCRYWWNTLNSDIMTMTKRCESCILYSRAQPHDPHIEQEHIGTLEPMEDVAYDLAYYGGKHHLVIVDRYSGYSFIKKLKGGGSTPEICTELIKVFEDFGYPLVSRADNGPGFRDAFIERMKEMGVMHNPSCEYNPARNGLAEKGIGLLKLLMKKCDEEKTNFEHAHQMFRQAPRADGHSPATMFFRRMLRNPDLPSVLSTETDISAAEDSREKTLQDTRNRTQTHKPLDKIEVGDMVRLRDMITGKWDKPGTVVAERGASFEVLTDTGLSKHRGRSLMKPLIDDGELRQVIEEGQDAGVQDIQELGEQRV